jgi:hypothetical protein
MDLQPKQNPAVFETVAAVERLDETRASSIATAHAVPKRLLGSATTAPLRAPHLDESPQPECLLTLKVVTSE